MDEIEITEDNFMPRSSETNMDLEENIAGDTPSDRELNAPYKSTGLEKYLQNTGDGKLILQAYKNNGNILHKNLRSQLVRLVIKREKNRHFDKVTNVNEKLRNYSII